MVLALHNLKKIFSKYRLETYIKNTKNIKNKKYKLSKNIRWQYNSIPIATVSDTTKIDNDKQSFMDSIENLSNTIKEEIANNPSSEHNILIQIGIDYLNTINNAIGLPWWCTIILFTITIRTVTLGSQLRQISMANKQRFATTLLKRQPNERGKRVCIASDSMI